jgi:pyridoxine kinase
LKPTRTLSGVTIQSLSSLANAISTLHKTYQIPHVIVTSIRLTPDDSKLSVVGSSARSDNSARFFKIDIPALPCFFSGTGDMFAALMVVRLREACLQAGTTNRTSWTSPDDVPATELPLAKATEKVLASMQMILEKTLEARDRELADLTADGRGMSSSAGVDVGNGGGSSRRHLAETKAAEVRLVRNVRDLWQPEERYKAVELQV